MATASHEYPGRTQTSRIRIRVPPIPAPRHTGSCHQGIRRAGAIGVMFAGCCLLPRGGVIVGCRRYRWLAAGWPRLRSCSHRNPAARRPGRGLRGQMSGFGAPRNQSLSRQSPSHRTGRLRTIGLGQLERLSRLMSITSICSSNVSRSVSSSAGIPIRMRSGSSDRRASS